MIIKSLVLTATVATALVSSGCAKHLAAPSDPGVCYAIAEQPDQTVKFNKLKGDVKSLEYCAVELERMRLSFLRMGGNVQDISGVYQGRFIFLTRDGVYTSQTFEGPRYLALVRYNGKLVMPGAVPHDP